MFILLRHNGLSIKSNGVLLNDGKQSRISPFRFGRRCAGQVKRWNFMLRLIPDSSNPRENLIMLGSGS